MLQWCLVRRTAREFRARPCRQNWSAKRDEWLNDPCTLDLHQAEFGFTFMLNRCFRFHSTVRWNGRQRWLATFLGVAGNQRGNVMKMKIHTLMASFLVASVAFMGAMSSAKADDWFVLAQKEIKAADPSVEIKSEGGRWHKDVKQVKLSAEGADVQITSIVLQWDNRSDVTMKDVGVLKAGGQTAPKDAPGRKGRLTAVTVQYKILGGAPTATLKVWGYD